MSASLARTLFRPSATKAAHQPAQRVCPAATFFPNTRSTRSARAANAVAHVTVAAALLASTAAFLSHPDTLFFDHPPRSAISWVPARHIAIREHCGTLGSSSSSPSLPTGPLSSHPSSPRAPPASSVLPGVGTQAEWRIAGVLGRSLF